MSAEVKIIDGSIILSYSFIYDESKVEENADLPKIENLLSYADRIFEQTKVYEFDKECNAYFKDIVLRIEGKKFVTYKLRIDYVKTLFFHDNIAVLYMKIIPATKDLKDLYNINRALTQFYSKQKSNESYIYFGKKTLDEIKIPLDEFEKFVDDFVKTKNTGEKFQQKDIKFCEEILEASKKEIKNYEEILSTKALKLAKYTDKDTKKLMIKVTPILLNGFTQVLLDRYYPVYTPYKSQEQRDYPYSGENHDGFKGQVGPLEKEKTSIENQNKNMFKSIKEEYNRHYLYYENQYKLVNQRYDDESIFEFIHYDTFITSLILKFVKQNKRLMYYDNFNPISTNYINSYITLVCDNLDGEYENNFLSFEPLLNSKASKGKKITNSDFFHIYQSQVDIFTLGNSHSILHLIDKDAKDIKNNKETTHFYTYMLTTIQRNFILNIITSSIVNINNIENSTINMKDSYKQLSSTLNKYNMFLTNYNFKIISNSASVDNSYNFFRKCNEVDKLAAQWSSISFKLKDFKSIISHILYKSPKKLALFILIFIVGFNLFNRLVNAFLDCVLNIPSCWEKLNEMGSLSLHFFR